MCICSPQVSLNWSSDEAKPGEQVSLTVTVTEPASQVGILVMEVDDNAPEVDQDFKEEKVGQAFRNIAFDWPKLKSRTAVSRSKQILLSAS